MCAKTLDNYLVSRSAMCAKTLVNNLITVGRCCRNIILEVTLVMTEMAHQSLLIQLDKLTLKVWYWDTGHKLGGTGGWKVYGKRRTGRKEGRKIPKVTGAGRNWNFFLQHDIIKHKETGTTEGAGTGRTKYGRWEVQTPVSHGCARLSTLILY